MLKCKDVAEQASHFLESDAPWYQKLSWHSHLFLCSNCRRFIRHLKLSISVSGQFAKSQTSHEEAQTIANKVRESCKHKPLQE